MPGTTVRQRQVHAGWRTYTFLLPDLALDSETAAPPTRRETPIRDRVYPGRAVVVNTAEGPAVGR